MRRLNGSLRGTEPAKSVLPCLLRCPRSSALTEWYETLTCIRRQNPSVSITKPGEVALISPSSEEPAVPCPPLGTSAPSGWLPLLPRPTTIKRPQSRQRRAALPGGQGAPGQNEKDLPEITEKDEPACRRPCRHGDNAGTENCPTPGHTIMKLA